jgi:hypothetical protein
MLRSVARTELIGQQDHRRNKVSLRCAAEVSNGSFSEPHRGLTTIPTPLHRHAARRPEGVPNRTVLAFFHWP